jgi:hypothetical protein
MAEITTEEVEKVIKSLENPKFKWRTVKGVAEECAVPQETVRRVIDQESQRILRSSALSKDGQELFTTRAHFLKKASAWEKFTGALRNRIG